MLVTSSAMIACPWYLEAVEILTANPQIGVGIHLTLNSEWGKNLYGNSGVPPESGGES